MKLKLTLWSFSFVFLLGNLETLAGGKQNNPPKVQKASGLYHWQNVTGNGLRLFIDNFGNLKDPFSSNGIEYPVNSGTYVVFNSGFVVSGIVKGEQRVSWNLDASRAVHWQPGPILNNGAPAAPDNPENRVYKLKKTGNPFLNPDFINWPVKLGADFSDNNKNGKYEPELGDSPIIYGDEMVWLVVNDLVPEVNRFPGSIPLGLEAQIMAFVVKNEGPAFDNSIFMVYKLINKSGNEINNAKFSLISDPDVGNAEDDFIGIDTIRGLQYSYNGNQNDYIYGSTPPAVGYSFFAGPLVSDSELDTLLVFGSKFPGKKSSGIQSAIFFSRGNSETFDPQSVQEAWSNLTGFMTTGAPFDPLKTGIGGNGTDNPKLVFSGSPETSSGWRDKELVDKRMLMNSGSFDMAPGDTQLIVVLVQVGQGANNLNSVSNLRVINDFVRSEADNVILPNLFNTGSGILSCGINQQQKTIGEIQISQTQNPDTLEIDLKNQAEQIQIPLVPGHYNLTTVLNSWGFFPDTSYDQIEIKTGATTELFKTISSKKGYFSDFWYKDTLNWVQFPATSFFLAENQTSPGWKVDNQYGNLKFIGNSTASPIYSVTSRKISLKNFLDPVVQFKVFGRFFNSTDSLCVRVLNPDGTVLKTVRKFTNNELNSPINSFYHQESLSDISSESDSVVIQLILYKNTLRTIMLNFQFLHVGERTSFPLGQVQLNASVDGLPVQSVTAAISGPFSTNVLLDLQTNPLFLPEGEYTATATAPPSWGVLSLSEEKVVPFVCKYNQVNVVAIPMKKVLGYRNAFSEMDTQNWSYAQPGDLNLWYWDQSGGISGLYQGCLSTTNILNAEKGVLSLTSGSMNLTEFIKPVLSFYFSGYLKNTPQTDTLFYQISLDNGTTWKMIGFDTQNPNTMEWNFRGFNLNQFGKLTSSAKIRFLFRKNSNNYCYIKLDNIEISEYTGVGVDESKNNTYSATGFRLFPAYPNPFNPATTLRWSQPAAGKAVIRILNLLGQDIQEINTGDLPAGENHLEVSFRHQPSGIYFYRIEVAGRQSETGKLLLVK